MNGGTQRRRHRSRARTRWRAAWRRLGPRNALEAFGWLCLLVLVPLLLRSVPHALEPASREMNLGERAGMASLAAAAILPIICVARWSSRPQTLRDRLLAARDPRLADQLARRSMSSSPASIAAGILSGIALLAALQPARAWAFGPADDRDPAALATCAWLITAIALMVVSVSAGAAAARARQRAENELALDPSIPFALFLRPFSSDGTIQVRNPMRSRWSLAPSRYHELPHVALERWLAIAVKPDYQLRVLGGDAIGPGAVVTAAWQAEFHRLAAEAKRIALIALPGKELVWELDQLRACGHLHKSAIIVPALREIRIDVDRMSAFRAELSALGFDLPEPGPAHRRVLLGPRGEVTHVRDVRFHALRDIQQLLGSGWPCVGSLARADLLGPPIARSPGPRST